MKTRPLGAIAVVVALTLPWVGLYVMNGGHDLAVGVTVLMSGVGIIGASFLLAFAAVYVVLGIAVLAVRRAAVRRLVRRSVTTVRGAVSGGGGPLTGGD